MTLLCGHFYRSEDRNLEPNTPQTYMVITFNSKARTLHDPNPACSSVLSPWLGTQSRPRDTVSKPLHHVNVESPNDVSSISATAALVLATVDDAAAS